MEAAAVAEQVVVPAVPVVPALWAATVVRVEGIAGVFRGLHIRLIPDKMENMVYQVIMASQGSAEQVAARESPAPTVSMAALVATAVLAVPAVPGEGTIITVAGVCRDLADPLLAVEETVKAVIIYLRLATATEGHPASQGETVSRG